MSAIVSDPAEARPGRWGKALVAGGGALFVAAGLLMWWGRGDAVFASYLVSAVAGCF